MLLVVIAILLVNITGAYDLVVHLDYGAFQGAVSTEYNVSYWQKIPYAAPPVGVNRWVHFARLLCPSSWTTVADNQPFRTSGSAPLNHLLP